MKLVTELAATWEIASDDAASKALDVIAETPEYQRFTPEQFGKAFDLAFQIACRRQEAA